MNFVSEAKLRERLTSLSSHEPRVVVGGNFATPWELLNLVVTSVERCRLFALNPQPGWPRRSGIITESPFLGPGVRGGTESEIDYLPMRLSLVPRLFRTLRQPDIVIVQTSPPRNGKVSLGIEVNILPAAIDHVRQRGGLVLAQVNGAMPYTRGDGEISVDDIDMAISFDHVLASPAPVVLDEAAQQIGDHVAALATDGVTVQTGIGQVPDAVLTRLLERREVRIWSEMISDGVMHLDRADCLDASSDHVASFLFGSPEFYDWVATSKRLVLRRTEVVNNPAQIAAQPKMLSVNTALEVDLYAQANASFVRGRIYSGFGGQPDFVSGALHSEGGQAVIALRSWHEKSNQSTIVPLLSQPACSFQHSVIATEHGVAHMLGRSQHAQARMLIEQTADPRAREALAQSAHSLGLLRAGD